MVVSNGPERNAARIATLNELYSPEGSPIISYRIPQFQRAYAWNEERQWEPLWGDLSDILERRIHEREEVRPHFMGAIVLQEQDAPSLGDPVTRYLVVDGQQRLTTLQLLIKATHDVLVSYDDLARADALDKMIINRAAGSRIDESEHTKIRQSNPNDQMVFHRIMTDPLGVPTISPIDQAYDFFKRTVNAWLSDDSAPRGRKADALVATLRGGIEVAAVVLSKDEKAHLIFETLNERGEPLTQSDRIKNTIMYEARVTDDEQRARRLWGMFENEWWRENTREGRLFRIHNDRFLNYWVVMKMRRSITSDRVAAEFRNYIRREAKDSPAEVEAIAEEIKAAGSFYRAMETDTLQRNRLYFNRLKIMEMGVVTPLLLYLYTSGVPEESLERSHSILESYLVRRMLCGLPSHGLNNLFMELLPKLGANEADAAILKHLGEQTLEARSWPNDRMVSETLTPKRLGGTVTRRKMVLEAIEQYHRGDKSEPLGDTSGLQIEHIMPQNWEQNWPVTEETEEAKERRSEAVNRIGNLTLVTGKLNSSMSNAPWEEKRGTLAKHSTLLLNSRLLSSAPETWDEETIDSRSKDMIEAICKIWPHAQSM